jgi:FkbM family methyltransferase
VSAREALRTQARRWFGRIPVRRRVLGVTLWLPLSHRLPEYVSVHPDYGRNVVELAALVGAATHGPLRLVDIGANVGDTARSVLTSIDARVLCVEPDPYWLGYLRRNAAGDPRITVEPALLLPDDTETPARVQRSGGTSSFVPATTGSALPTMTATELRRRHPDFADARLVKCDTDGYDAALMPALARGWRETRPVLFFEYDPVLTQHVGQPPAQQMWSPLGALGYRDVFVWANVGTPLAVTSIDELAARTAAGLAPADTGCDYWDVAVLHTADNALADRLRAHVAWPALP